MLVASPERRRLDVLSCAASVSAMHLPAHPCSEAFRSTLMAMIPVHADSVGFRKALVDFHGILVGEAAPARFGLRAPAYCLIREAEALYVGRGDPAEYTTFVSKLRRYCDAVIQSAPRIPGETDAALRSRKDEMHAEKEAFFRCARNHKQSGSCRVVVRPGHDVSVGVPTSSLPLQGYCTALAGQVLHDVDPPENDVVATQVSSTLDCCATASLSCTACTCASPPVPDRARPCGSWCAADLGRRRRQCAGTWATAGGRACSRSSRISYPCDR